MENRPFDGEFASADCLCAVPPTRFWSVAQSHRIAREEISGPVLAAMTFCTADEAIETADNLA